jgi:hypothetical protein
MIIIRAIIIVLAVFFGFLFTRYILVPSIYTDLCLTNTNNCLQIEYWKLDNSALIHVFNTGMWLWYTGKYYVIYNENTSLQCEDGFAPATIFDTSSTIKNLSNFCVSSLDKIQQFYKDKPYTTLYERVNNPYQTDAFKILELFFNKKILF